MTGTGTFSPSPLARQLSEVATIEGEFLLRSGSISHQYFDKYRFEGNPDLLRQLAKEMSKLLPSGTEIVAGLEMGGIPLATAISLETGLPAAFVRKGAKTYGTCRAIEGQDVAGKKVTIIEDVITTGGAVADALRLASLEGADVVATVCAIWRGDGNPKVQAAPHLPIYAVFSKEDLIG
ncbi:orotate phosphoribosyltransferase [Ruegeria conchae]|uniref:orotate phosphoribosyltransferase n=1 Tax=Ruegeria conchae TaxID=981384 RepID=UPI0029C603A1|nr:orotate phosphoribosyltransferase [Ruegeria conchae]